MNLRSIQLTILAATAFCAAGSGIAAEEKIDLKWKITPGEYVLTIEQDSTNDIEMDAAPQPMQTSQKMLMVMQLKSDTAGDKFKNQMTYKRVKMSTTAMGMTMTYDSADPDATDSPMHAVLGSLVGHTISATMTADGKIVSVEGADELWDRMAKGNPAMGQMAEQMKSQFGQQMFTQMNSQQMAVMPNKPVAKGDTWTNTSEMNIPMVGTTKIETKCKLLDIVKTDGNTFAVIDAESKITTSETTKPVEIMGAELKVEEMDLTIKSTNRVNVKTGAFTESKGKMAGSMAMKMDPPPGTQGAEPMKMKIKLSSTLKTTATPGTYKAPTTQPKPAATPAGN